MKNIGVFWGSACAFVLSISSPSRATLQWVQQPRSAIAIAVGADDHPFIVDSTGHAFRGSPHQSCWTTPTTGTLCVSTGQLDWQDLGGTVANVAASIDGGVAATNNAGRLYFGGGIDGFSWSSDFHWLGVDTYFDDNSAACIRNLAIAGDITKNVETFSVWGEGCGYETVYEITPDLFQIPGDPPSILALSSMWGLVDTVPASRVYRATALFSDGSGLQLAQNPWVVEKDKNVYALDGASFVRVARPWFDSAQLIFATDHYVATTGSVYEWTGDLYGHGTGNTLLDWTYVIGETPNAPIFQIASSGALAANNRHAAMPGSNLYAIDTAGNIYEAEDSDTGLPPK